MRLRSEFMANSYMIDNIANPKRQIDNSISKLDMWNKMITESALDNQTESLLESVDNIDLPKYYSKVIGNDKKYTLNEMYTMSSMLMNTRPPSDVEIEWIKPIADKVQELINYISTEYPENEVLDILEQLDLYRQSLIAKKNNMPITDVQFSDYTLKKSLTENAMLNEAVEGESYFTISRKIFDEKDPEKLVKMLPLLDSYFASFTNVTRGAVKNCEIVIRYLFHKFSTNPSYIRRFTDHLIAGVSILRELPMSKYLEEMITLVEDKIEFNKSYVPKVIKESIEFDYDIIIETGMDDVIELLEECISLEEQSVLNEGFADIKATVKEKAKKLNQAQKRASRKLDNTFQRVLDDYRRKRKEETEDGVIKSTVKLSTWLKRILTAGAIHLTVGPALSALYIITNVALHSNTKRKYKQLLLNDLKAELKIVQEKIRDADRNGDNKAKYKLMRLETQLEASINKVVFNVNSI